MTIKNITTNDLEGFTQEAEAADKGFIPDF